MLPGTPHPPLNDTAFFVVSFPSGAETNTMELLSKNLDSRTTVQERQRSCIPFCCQNYKTKGLTKEVQMNIELIIDPEFVACIPPLTQDEFEQLERNVVSAGKMFSPILVWGKTIIDGHNRYRILQNHPEIDYRLEQIEFENRYEAIAYICGNQIGRRNLNENQIDYIIGKKYDAEMESHRLTAQKNRGEGGRFHRCGQIDHNGERTRDRIAKQFGISSTKVRRDLDFARGIDAAEEEMPGIREMILQKEITPTKQAISNISRLEKEDRKEAVQDLLVAENRAANFTPKASATNGEKKPVHSVEKQVNEPSIQKSMQGAVETFIDTIENYLTRFPGLLEDEYRDKTISILNVAKQYIMKKTGE